jgi:hypothetical protein
VKRFLTGLLPLPLLAVVVVAVSIYFDLGKQHWLWFQRSGSLLVIIGAMLTYRSIMRLGVQGVGGAPVSFGRGAVMSVDDSGPLQIVSVELDDETKEMLAQEQADKLFGYFGVFTILLGTVVWGYGDLLGGLFSSTP